MEHKEIRILPSQVFANPSFRCRQRVALFQPNSRQIKTMTVTSTVTAGNPAIARPFAIMQLVGGALLLITLVTAILAKDVKRNLSWISFCSASIISCVAYDLLFFVGQQTGPSPDRGLCLVQSALVHAVPVMQAGVNLALIAHTWTSVRAAVYQKNRVSRCNLFILFVAFPYILTIALFLGFLVFAIQHPQTVERDNMGVYCKIVFDGVPSKITAGISAVLMLVSVIFEVIVARMLIRHWKLLCHSGMPRSFVIRVLVFSAVGGLVLVLTMVYVVSDGGGTGADFIMASLPLISSLVFGTQEDLIRAWMFWRPPRPMAVKPIRARNDSEGTLE
ncbi:hypothetical protein CCMSSC00406_0000780 [Pleurotus cornucopiae]|uniref:Uncharacterized protein n=1 Tax=Pleurotus cornucopiae TaxID=5321 RepID=A0ACB7JCM9_PLECO|nr:hypothetical protein CCMSSC00406_0000780 [Pleurotus cornucopiae]